VGDGGVSLERCGGLLAAAVAEAKMNIITSSSCMMHHSCCWNAERNGGNSVGAISRKYLSDR
jgi:hypothetical protein